MTTLPLLPGLDCGNSQRRFARAAEFAVALNYQQAVVVAGFCSVNQGYVLGL